MLLIKGRQILDCNAKGKGLIIKIDLEKAYAYDKTEWDFLDSSWLEKDLDLNGDLGCMANSLRFISPLF